MGQDRKFTDKEIKYVLNCVNDYKKAWEAREVKNLEQDVIAKIDSIEYDKLYKEHFES